MRKTIFQFSKKKKKKSCLLITKRFLLWLFWKWKIWYFLSKRVDGNMIFTDYWKVLVLIVSGIENTVFFEPKSWWKEDIYWLLKKSCFKLSDYGKCNIFISPKFDGKMMFTWSFWACHDISGLGKYGFSCSDSAWFLHKKHT